jgi:hypothetical protein
VQSEKEIRDFMVSPSAVKPATDSLLLEESSLCKEYVRKNFGIMQGEKACR